MYEANQGAETDEGDAATVFLTAVPSQRRARPEALDSARAADAPAVGVFVDASGRRRRLIRRAALCVSALAGGYGVLVVLSLLGGPVPPNVLLPVPGGPGAPSPGHAATGAPVAGAGSAAAKRGPGSGTAQPLPAVGLPAVPSQSATSTAPAVAAPSASPSATGHRPSAPPGQGGKTASSIPTNAHGH